MDRWSILDDLRILLYEGRGQGVEDSNGDTCRSQRDSDSPSRERSRECNEFSLPAEGLEEVMLLLW